MYFDYNYLPDYTEPLYRPPSEARSLIFQITEGCSYNGCTFCGMYITKKFSLKPMNKIKEEIDRIPESIREEIHKIFLADGDAVIYPFEELMEILDYINLRFPKLRRISSYAGPHAIYSKTQKEWQEIYNKNLTLLYFGLESGNNKVLELMNKDMKADEIEPHCINLREIGFKLSVMVILGGGGRRYSVEHAIDSAKWISKVNPDYFSLLTLFIRRKKDYFKKIEAPSIGELMNESKMIIENIEGKNIIFRSNHISNFVSLEGILSKDKEKVLKVIDSAIKNLKSKNQFDLVPDFYQENML
jgi:radical SAM superfamily enzyme YgiQ (UPF0313 family)